MYCTGCDKPSTELKMYVAGLGVALTNGMWLSSYICNECIDKIKQYESQIEEQKVESNDKNEENKLICSFCNQPSKQRAWLLCRFYNVSTKDKPDGELLRIVHYRLFHAVCGSGQLMGSAVICGSCVDEVQKVFNSESN